MPTPRSPRLFRPAQAGRLRSGAHRLAALTLVACAGWAAPAGAQGVGTPAVFGGGPQRGGGLDTRGIDRAGVVRWEVRTDGPVRGSPIVADGVVYAGSHDGFLRAVDLEDGRVLWRYAVGEPVTSAPALARDLVVVNDRNGALHAVGRADGAVRWSLEPDAPLPWPWGLEGWDYVGSTPAVVDGRVIAGASDGAVRALDAASGALLWTVRTEGPVRSTPAVSDGTVFVGSADGVVRALSLDDGRELWRFETRGASLESADFGFDRRTITGGPAVADGRVFVGSRDARMYALDAGTGREIWANDDGGASAWIISTPAVAGGRVIFGRSSSSKAQALDAGTGALIWDTPMGGPVFSSPVVVDGLAIMSVGSAGGGLVAVDAETGAIAWRRQLGTPSWSSPTVSGGVAVLGADDGVLRAIEAAAGPAPRLAVFRDSTLAVQSLSERQGTAVGIADYLTRHGFELLDAGALEAFLVERLADRAPSAVVMATDALPASVASGAEPTGLLHDYLEAGGKVVWTGAPPFWLEFDADGGGATADVGRPGRYLGVDFVAWVSDSRTQRPTAAGRAWGLDGWWTGPGGIDPTTVSTVLVTDEEGRASGWVRAFGGPAGSGWVSLPRAPDEGWLARLRRVAEAGVTRAF